MMNNNGLQGCDKHDAVIEMYWSNCCAHGLTQ